MENFVKVDLHIHTPASIKCYEGNKDESEYLRIIRRAAEKQIKLIAITDHNTIHGYKEIQRIYNELLEERRAWSNKRTQCKRTLQQIDSDIDLFKQVTILPGIEFETQDCIHILLIFEPKKPIGEIEDILSQAGYPPDVPSENDMYVSSWNLISMLNNIENIDCICLDAHTDSKKGIFNDTKHEYKLRSLSHSKLNGLCYCDENNVEKIQYYLDHSASRQTPIAMMHFSDAHQVDKIGSRLTWFRMAQTDYHNLKVAFLNPLEYISVLEPKLSNIIDLIKNNPSTVYIDKLDNDSVVEVQKAVCSVVNNGGGYCLIGISKRGAVKGIKVVAEYDFQTEFKQKILLHIVGPFSFGVTKYPISEEKFLYSIRLSASRKLVYIKGDSSVYSVNNHVYEVCSVDKTWVIAEDKALAIVNSAVTEKVDEIEKKLSDLKHTLESITIVDKYFDKGLSLTSRFKENSNMLISYNPDNLPRDLWSRFAKSIEDNNANGFGMIKGKYIYLDRDYSIRFPHAYVRLTPVKFNQRRYPRANNIPKNSIVLTSTGMSLYIPDESIAFSKLNEPFFVLVNNALAPELKKCYVMFLKSSYFLWIMLLKFGDRLNFLAPNVLQYIRVPSFLLSNNYHAQIVKKIVSYYDLIYKKELSFLESVQKTNINSKNPDNPAVVDAIIRNHNDNVDPLYYSVDLLLYTYFGLSEEDVLKVENFLIARNCYLPPENIRKEVLCAHKKNFGKRK